MRAVQLHNIEKKGSMIVLKRRGPVTWEDCGITSKGAFTQDGILRLVFDFGQLNFIAFSKEVYIELIHAEIRDEVHWDCEFNGEPVLATIEEEKHSSTLFFDRDQIMKAAHHHNNILTVCGDFSEPVFVDVKKSTIQFLASS